MLLDMEKDSLFRISMIIHCLLSYKKFMNFPLRNAILTDNHLHVDNTEGVYALGDCATIELHRLADEVHHLFHLADKNKDGSLSLDEFEGIFIDIF